MMRVAIIGSGYGMQAHYPAFSSLPGVKVEMVANSGRFDYSGNFPDDLRYCRSINEILESPVEIVCVAVPPCSQAEIALKVLSAGKHLFCEKPFGNNFSQAEAVLNKVAEKANLVTAVNFQYRFEPMLLKLHEFISSGALGAINWLNFSWITGGRADPLLPWSWRNSEEEGGGVIGGFVCHMVDLVSWLSRQEILSIQAKLQTIVQERPDVSTLCMRKVTASDTALVQMDLERFTAQLRVTNCQWGGDGMRLEIGGNRGVVLFKNTPPFQESNQTLEFFGPDGHKILWQLSDLENSLYVDSRESALRKIASKFIQSINGLTDPNLPTALDALRIQRILEAIKLSSVDHKVVLIN